MIELSECLSYLSSALRLSITRSSLCYGLPHPCNGKPLDKPYSVSMSHVNQGRSGMKTIFSLRLSKLFHPDNKSGATLCWQEAALQSTFLSESQQRMWKYRFTFGVLFNLHNTTSPHAKIKEAHMLLSCFHYYFCYFSPQTGQEGIILSSWKSMAEGWRAMF